MSCYFLIFDEMMKSCFENTTYDFLMFSLFSSVYDNYHFSFSYVLRQKAQSKQIYSCVFMFKYHNPLHFL